MPAVVPKQSTETTNPKESQLGGTKVHDFLNLAGKILPIAGAVGTLFVWLAANFYVGDVQISPDRPFSQIEVKVSDKKGQESTFHTPKFQLMPGEYHVSVAVDSMPNQHADLKVSFHHQSLVPVAGPTTPETKAQPEQTVGQSGETDSVEQEQPSVHHHWWQFWKRTKNAVSL